MSEVKKQQSSPFSTGGGGPNFETRVKAAFTVLLHTGRVAPCLPTFPIIKIILQGRYSGFSTDDFIVFVKDPNTEKDGKFLAQIKHDISISAGRWCYPYGGREVYPSPASGRARVRLVVK